MAAMRNTEPTAPRPDRAMNDLAVKNDKAAIRTVPRS